MYKMLISINEVKKILVNYNIDITGIFHIGAHECEELTHYKELGIKEEDIIWVEAIPSKVKEAKQKGILNIYNEVITNKDNDNILFNISNNVQSSSIFAFGTHSKEHPQVKYIDKMYVKTITVDTFFKKNKIKPLKYNFWNLDIQGAELIALQGSSLSLENVKILYLEVNEKELYKGCGMITQIDDFLKKYKFTRVLTKMTKHGWGDALYLRL